jgi:DNA replication and repair protein RecF
MYLKSITYENYRNVESAKIIPEKGVNVLQGFNAQGKTNLLEGIYYFACGKSFRGATDKELIRLGCDSGEVSLFFEDKDRQRSHKMMFFDKERKICFKEGIKISRMSDFIGVFRAVLFSPEHLSIIKDGPSERRAFLDIAISQLYPAYMASLSKYKKLLMQRNALLKEPEAEGFKELLYVISAQMAHEAAFISEHREKYVKKLSSEVGALISDMTLGREKATLDYSKVMSEDEYLKKFTLNVEKELLAKTTLYGVHKDDIEVALNGLDSRVYASQGQQRSLALAMKIAEGEISRSVCGEYPVFLFDDILSELDVRRKDFILSGLKDKQVVITCCEDIPKGKIFTVSNGSVTL